MSSRLKHILIADDDRDDVELFQSALDQVCPDLMISVASNGIELINLLKNFKKPDAIILDLNMPYKDGKQCLKEIRTMADYNNIPVVMLTTSSSKSDMEYCLSNGANDYLIKPLSFSELKNIVENICTRQLGWST